MVEVFKTNIRKLNISQEIVEMLKNRFPDHKINFDLEDCDNILRVEASRPQPAEIVRLIEGLGFQCETL